MTVKIMMTKQELVNLYNKYIRCETNNKEEGDLWEALYDFSSSFLCYIHCNEDDKDDVYQDLLYNLLARDDYFSTVKDFKGLVNELVGKLKKYAKHYYKWENKEQEHEQDQKNH